MSSNKTIKWGPIGKQVYERTYSREKQDGSMESWEETVSRVVDGNLALVPSKHHKRGEREQLYKLFSSFASLPAGRHLWMTGVPGRQFLYNCHISGWTNVFSEHFAFTFDELMKGGGVGANYSNRFMHKLPALRNGVSLHVVCDPAHPDYDEFSHLLSSEYSYKWPGCIPVEDSREGWVDCLVRLLEAYINPRPVELVLDVSRVRQKNSPIRTFGGKASGPGPLVSMLFNVNDILSSRVGERLTSLDAMLIDHYIAKCVVAGNVRRSARMSVKYWKDADIFDFINCKGDKARTAHTTTNISVEIDHAFFRAFKKGDEHAKSVYTQCIEGMYESGEPGFWNSSLSQVGEVEEVVSGNPCLTSDTWIMTVDGPRQISELINSPFISRMGDNINPSTNLGFFETGIKEVFEVNTSKGFSFKCTDNHKIRKVINVTSDFVETEWTPLSSLSTGDRIELSNQRSDNIKWAGQGSWKEGWLLGSLLGDGTFTERLAILDYWGDNKSEMSALARTFILDSVGARKDCGTSIGYDRVRLSSKNLKALAYKYNLLSKNIGSKVEKSSSEFYKGFLCGWFDADGSPQGNLKKGASVRLSSVKLNNLKAAQRMLSRLGIISTIYENRADAGMRPLPDGSGGTKKYFCQATHELVISKDNIGVFSKLIGFKDRNKKERLNDILDSYSRTPNRERFVDTIVSIKSRGKKEVYDCQIPNFNEFDGNGLRLHNCGEIILNPFENCNLGHVNLDAFYDNFDGAVTAFKLMTRFLIRATFADICSPLQRDVVDRNRRIGVGFFGFQGWLCKQGIKYSDCHQDSFVKESMRTFYKAIREEARSYAFELRIPEPVKVTALAPTGTIAKLPGKSESCQAIFSRYFDRRTIYSKDNAQVEELKAQGVTIEESYYEPDRSVVAVFRCKDQLVDEMEELGMDTDLVEDQSEISLKDSLAIQAMLQREFADNAISFTINMIKRKTKTAQEKQKKELYHTILHYLPELKGTTVFFDTDRPQSPYTRISKEDYESSNGPRFTSQGSVPCKGNVCPIK